MERRLKKETYKLLTLKLKRYQELKEDIFEIEEESSCNNNGFDINSSIRGNSTSDKVGRIAIKLADNKQYNEYKAWKDSIDELYLSYARGGDYVKSEFIRRRYIIKKLKNFEIPYNISLKDNHVIMDLELEGINYSARTWKYWKSEIVYQFYLIAKRKNLIKSDEN